VLATLQSIIDQFSVSAHAGNPLIIDEVICRLSELSGKGKQPIKTAIRQAVKEVKAINAQKIRELEVVEVAAGRARIEHQPDNLNKMVDQVQDEILARPEEGMLLNLGGLHAYAAIMKPAQMHAIDCEDEPPPAVPLLKVHDRQSIELRIDKACCFHRLEGEGIAATEIPIVIPDRVVSAVWKHPRPKAPAVFGLVVHPLILPDGRCLQHEGLDAGVLQQYGGFDFLPVPEGHIPRQTAVDALSEIKSLLLTEFEFAGETDAEGNQNADAAVSLLLTALQRKVMDQAPAYLLGASVQGSGKTTMARMVHVIVTGKDMPVSQLSPDRTEAKKEMLSLLIEQLSFICFDNIEDGSVISHPIISAVLTAPDFTGRVLGVSRNATVPTNATIVFTGNNLSVDRDLASRVLPVQLDPQCDRPDRRSFKNSDVVNYSLQIRQRVVLLGNLIVASYVRSGENVLNEMSRFKMWDRFVRGPIVWAGGIDPIGKFEQSHDESPDVAAHTAIMSGLWIVFGSNHFTVSDVINRLKVGGLFPSDIGRGDVSSSVESGKSLIWLHDAIEEYREGASSSARSMGWLLKKFLDRITRDGRYKLRRTTQNGQSVYRVESQQAG